MNLLSSSLLLMLAATAGVAQSVVRETQPGLHRGLNFVANAGQWADPVLYCALGADTVGWILRDGFAQRFERWSRAGDRPRVCEGAVVRTRFLGGAGSACSETPAGAPFHFMRGGLAVTAGSFERVRLARLLPGVDLAFRQSGTGGLEYDVCLGPGHDGSELVGECEGAEFLSIDADGALCARVGLPDGASVTLRHHCPVAWQATVAGRRPVEARFRLLGGTRFGFHVRGADPACATVIDPGLVWSTMLGGGSGDSVNDLQWRPGQGLWIGGFASSTDFPVTPGAFRTTGGLDGFVARLAEDGRTLQWATYLGGNSGDEVRAIAIDSGLAVTAVGWTQSTDFPVVAGAVRPTYGGASPVLNFGDAFVARLSANGSTLLGGTYLGGHFDDCAEGVDIAPNGDLVVAGWTSSPDFPTTAGSFQPALGGPVTLQPDGFVARLSPDCRAFAFSTYLGGMLPDQLLDVRVDALGQATAVGYSVSANYPTSALGYRTTSAGGTEAVVTRLNAAGSALVWSTYLGGQEPDLGLCIDLAADGSVWIGGSTASANFPTTPGALQRQLLGRLDGFVAHLSANGQSLLYSTLFGGAGDDTVRDLSLSPGGQPFFVGETMGGIPVTATAPQPNFGGGTLDGFAAELDASGSALVFGTYLGGQRDDYLLAAARASSGLAVVAGFTFSADFPVTPGVLQPVLRGTEDGVVAKLDLQTTVNGFLGVGAGAGLADASIAPGEAVDALLLDLQNATDRPLQAQSVRLALGGSGDDAADLDGVSLWLDDPLEPGRRDVLLAGPVPVPVDDGEVVVPLTALPALLPGAAARLVAVLHTRPGIAAGREFACAVVGDDAWVVQAEGAGQPHVAIEGGSRITGPVLTIGVALPFAGDADGDGLLTVADLRRLCCCIGQPAGAADPDGDGRITEADIGYLRDVILGRSVVIACPGTLTRGTWATVRGWFAGSAPTVTVGGRVLRIGPLTPHEFTFHVDADLSGGSQDIEIELGGRLYARRVDLQ